MISEFKILPNILGVNPQTSHRVLKLVIYQTQQITQKTDANSKKDLQKLQKFRFCSYETLEKVKIWVSERFRELGRICNVKECLQKKAHILSPGDRGGGGKIKVVSKSEKMSFFVGIFF